MVVPGRIAAAALLFAGLLGCRAEPGGGTVVLVIDLAAGAPRPHHLSVRWQSADRGTTTYRVPRTGALPETGAPLATVRFDLTSDPLERRVVVRGLDVGERPLAVAAKRVAIEGPRQEVPLLLTATLPDGDGDDLPDVVDDDCPTTPCTAVADAAPEPPPDAAPDLFPDTAPPFTVRPELAQGLVGYWKLDDAPGSLVARDSSGNGNHGAVPPEAPWVAGLTGGAIDFMRKVAVRIEPSPSIDRITNRLTVAAWIWSRNPNAPTAVLSRHVGNAFDLYYLQVSSGFPQFLLNTAEKGPVLKGRRVMAQTWQHLAATWDGARVKLFVDGVVVAEEAYAETLRPVTTPLFIGGNSNTADNLPAELFSGPLDDVLLYDRALSAEEIGWLAARSQPPAR